MKIKNIETLWNSEVVENKLLICWVDFKFFITLAGFQTLRGLNELILSFTF